MSLWDCVQRAMDDEEIAANRARGERAQKMFRDLSDKYERDGHPRHAAEALAGDDVKEAFRREAGERRHVRQRKQPLLALPVGVDAARRL